MTEITERVQEMLKDKNFNYEESICIDKESYKRITEAIEDNKKQKAQLAYLQGFVKGLGTVVEELKREISQ